METSHIGTCFKMWSAVFLIEILILTSLIHCKDQCDEKKRMKVIKRMLSKSLNDLKDMLDDIGCPLKKASTDVTQSIESSSVKKRHVITTQPSTKITESAAPVKKSFEDKCAGFEPVKDITNSIYCFLSKTDLERGISIEHLRDSKLCTEIIMLVKHIYEDVGGKSTFKFANFAEDSSLIQSWVSMGLKIFMQIGSWNNPNQVHGQKFSRSFDMTKARERFAVAVANQIQLAKFDGVLFSWYYPGCPQDDCKLGPSVDEHNLVHFLKRFNEIIKERSISMKIALEVSVRAENIFMGFSLERLTKLTDFMLFENTSPENRICQGDVDTVTKYNKVLTQFGALEELAKHIASSTKRLAKLPKSQKLIELETITVYSSSVKENLWKQKNITSKKLCSLVLASNGIEKNLTLQWPLPQIKNGPDIYPFSDYDYTMAKVKLFMESFNFGGIWIRDIWADDVGNECGCGSYPILRAANEAIGRSTCKLPNCPIK